MKKEPPIALTDWFILHFVMDMFVAIPLFLFPEKALDLAGWETVDPLLSRVVAAAFFGIGIESLIGRNATLDSFKNMLNLKIIWSFTAILGIGWAMFSGAQGGPLIGWLALATFVIFHFIWIYWRVRVGRILKEPEPSSK